MYVVQYSEGSVAFPVEGLDHALLHAYNKERADYLLTQSLRLATAHATRLRSEGHQNVLVLRAGRQSTTKGWLHRSFKGQRITRNPTGEVVTHDEAWIIPHGYVDPEADKHGPQVTPRPSNHFKRTNQEKIDWYNTHKSTIKTSLWM